MLRTIMYTFPTGIACIRETKNIKTLPVYIPDGTAGIHGNTSLRTLRN